MLAVFCDLINSVRPCLHGGWVPQVGEVTHFNSGEYNPPVHIISHMVTPPIM